MFAKVAWVSYWAVAFVVLPILFRARFRRWPFVLRIPGDAYSVMEYAYGGVLLVFTSALLFGPAARVISLPAGGVLMVGGAALQVWAVWALGPNWRFGQDPDDHTCRHVSHGPFRFVRHPVYLSLMFVACGQMCLLGVSWRTLFFLIATALYAAIQGRAETRHWARRVPR